MCGLVLVINRDGRPVEPRLLDQMGESLAARGPDGAGQLVDGAVGLFHRRLAIFDSAAGAQPMHHPGADVHLIFNGAVYNHIELRATLEADGARFRTHTDTEVVLEVLVRYGIDGLNQFNGMFGLVAYDARNRRVIIARDRFGIRPLYVYQDAAVLLVASEIKSLLAHPVVEARVDPRSLHDYVTFQHVIGAGTLFGGIRKLEPGHALQIDLSRDTVESTVWWSPQYAVRPATEEASVEALEEALDRAIRLRTRGDVAVGVELSGGLDSSVIAHLAARERPIVAFHGRVLGGPAYDESRFARAVAQAGNFELVEVPIDGNDLVERLPRLIHAMDEPCAGPGLIGQAKVAEVAADRVGVMLGGHGADELFGGYARYLAAYLEQALKGAICGTNDEGQHIVSWQTILPNLPVLRTYIPMLQSLFRDGLFEPMDRRYFRLLDRAGSDLDLYTDAFRAEHCVARQFERFSALFHHPDTESYINKMRAFDRVGSLPALLQVADRVNMGVGIEGRTPFLDHHVAEIIDHSAPRLIFGGGHLKHLLRVFARKLQPGLPVDVVERSDKMGFPVPLGEWFRGPARELVGDVLLSPVARDRGVVSASAVERWLAQDVGYSRKLWGALCLELWFQTFID